MISECCLNPVCKAELGPHKRRGKKFCSDRCRLHAWILKRAAELVLRLPSQELWQLFHGSTQEQREEALGELGPQRDVLP
jgi:hypothetical protein